MVKANITIYDIAKLAGCSPATVYLALNNDLRVKESTKKKISEIANSLHYKPNIISIVLCGSSGKNIDGLNFVKCDIRLGDFLAVNHLISRGHKRIGCIFPVFDKSQCESRLRGYVEALNKSKISYDSSLVKYCTATQSDIHNTTIVLVGYHSGKKYFCKNDY